jgi:molybdopterin-containing oxidoreductase family membrane subunit
VLREGASEHVDVLAAVMRPFGKPSKRYWLAVALLAAVVALGLVAWIYQLRQGMAVAGYRDSAFWAIYIANVVTFIGVSYGGAVVSAILLLTGASWRAPLVRLAEGVALVTVAVGGAFIIPHLGRPDRLADMVLHGNVASPVFWDMVAILTYTFATFVFFLLPLVPDTASLLDAHPEELGRVRRSLCRFLSRGWVGSDHQRRVLHSAVTTVAILIIPLAVSVHSVLGWAFALVTRPGWHESIWAPYFVIAALYSGVALVIVVVAAFRRGYHLEAFITEKHFVRLAFIMVALGAVYVYLTFADLLPSGYVGQHEPTAIIQGMLLGRVAVWFWIFVIAGTLLPIVLVGLRRTRTIPGIVTASVLVLVAMWIKRLIMVTETASYNHLTNSFGVGFRFTWVSVSATLAGVAAVALLLMLLFRLVPLLSIAEIQQLPHPTDEQETEQRPPAKAVRRHGAGHVGALLLVVMAGCALGLARTQPAYAESSRPRSPTVSVTAVENGLNNTLTATVTANGEPVAGALVKFSESTTMFAPGDNQVPLGSVETDTSGTAVVTYVAAVTGPRTITATYFPTVMSDPVVGKASLDVTQAANRYRAPPANALSGVGHTLVLTLFGLVLLVLGLLTAQVVRVRRACRPATNGLPSQ